MHRESEKFRAGVDVINAIRGAGTSSARGSTYSRRQQHGGRVPRAFRFNFGSRSRDSLIAVAIVASYDAPDPFTRFNPPFSRGHIVPTRFTTTRATLQRLAREIIEPSIKLSLGKACGAETTSIYGGYCLNAGIDRCIFGTGSEDLLARSTGCFREFKQLSDFNALCSLLC